MTWERGIKRIYLVLWAAWAAYVVFVSLRDVEKIIDDPIILLINFSLAVLLPGAGYILAFWVIRGYKSDL